MVIIGIDPGKQGGIAIKNGEEVIAYDMPIMPNGEIDACYIATVFSQFSEAVCVIEKAQAMPQQGVVSVFNYGRGFGKLQALLEIHQFSFLEIPPMKWKKHYGLVNKSKAESVTLAQKLFPKIPLYTPRGRKLDGKAEALLLMNYASFQYQKEGAI